MTEDVVREALNQTVCVDEPFEFATVIERATIITFLKHILEAGPDERMGADKGFNLKFPEPAHLPRWFASQKALLKHIISRLEENTNDS